MEKKNNSGYKRFLKEKIIKLACASEFIEMKQAVTRLMYTELEEAQDKVSMWKQRIADMEKQ